ncbi:MAG TPA: thioredoxin family protein [Kofleriaceae bacterium]|nr:thioredoxin family protein [Kofleriaceae bacterium]
MASVTRAACVLAALALAAACGPKVADTTAAPGTTTPKKPRKAPAKVAQVNATGEPVDLANVLVPGHVTVVDFWATWCGGCEVVDQRLMASIAKESRVVVRKIDVGDGDTPVARQHKVGALPHVRIYDRDGNLRYVLAGNDALTAGDAAKTLAAE